MDYPVTQLVKSLPVWGRIGFNSWVGKDRLLEEGMAAHSSIVTWRIQVRWTEEPGRLPGVTDLDNNDYFMMPLKKSNEEETICNRIL